MSNKKRAEKRDTDKHRAFYVAGCESCEVCRSAPATDCHEIPAGSSRHRAVYLPNVWLGLCSKCHDMLQGSTFAVQLNYKVGAIRHDINRCLGRNEV